MTFGRAGWLAGIMASVANVEEGALTFACADYTAHLRIEFVVFYGHQEIRLIHWLSKLRMRRRGRENVRGKVCDSRKSCHRNT
ncbi:MAG: hypothetical protein WAZ77_20645 [Candidatus Nitrosopolaris sp.]|jgi:hypothetical protein